MTGALAWLARGAQGGSASRHATQGAPPPRRRFRRSGAAGHRRAGRRCGGASAGMSEACRPVSETRLRRTRPAPETLGVGSDLVSGAGLAVLRTAPLLCLEPAATSSCADPREPGEGRTRRGSDPWSAGPGSDPPLECAALESLGVRGAGHPAAPSRHPRAEAATRES